MSDPTRAPKLPSREPDLGAPGSSGRRPLSDLTPESIRAAIGASNARPYAPPPPVMPPMFPQVGETQDTQQAAPSAESWEWAEPSAESPQWGAPVDTKSGEWAQAGRELSEMRRTGDRGGVVKVARRIYLAIFLIYLVWIFGQMLIGMLRVLLSR